MRRRAPRWTALLLACAGVLLVPAAAPAAHAQEVRLAPDDGTGEHPAGVYTGVKPGGNEAPAVPVKAGVTPATVTWPGFQMRPDGSSRVFLQTSVSVTTAGSLLKRSFVVELGDAPIAGDTNRFPLLTQHFNTPVTRVELKRANRHTTLIITLRADVQPQVSSEQAQSGFFFLYVDFPAGNYLAMSGEPSVSPPRPTDGAALDTAPSAPSPPSPPAPVASAGAGANASAQVSAGTDSERPPGIAKPKAKAKAKTSGKAKIGF
jgi:hypothetical protein